MLLRTRLAVLIGAAFTAAMLATSGAHATVGLEEEPHPENPPFPVAACTNLMPTIVGAGFIVGGNGPDVIVGSAGPDTIFGLGGNDVIVGLAEDDVLVGGDGNDLICAGWGDDDAVGGPGNDTVYGEPGDDDMSGGDGEDWLIGGPHLQGDRGNGGADVDACPTTEILANCP
jgi:Ca2+-binding RTX toxin-like protein